MPIKSKIIVINGFPGVGKLTIARILRHSIEARLVDNHTILNPAEVLFERDNPLWWSLYSIVKDSTFDHIGRLKTGETIIFTDCLANIAEDITAFERYRELSHKMGYELILVTIACTEEENARRLVSENRAFLQKLSRPNVLSDLLRNYTLLRCPEKVRSIELDVTELSPSEAAKAIEERILS